jgi:hypothetical protein
MLPSFCSSALHTACCVLLCPQGALDNMNLFQVITIMAFFMLLPVSVLIEGLPILPQNLAAAVRAILTHSVNADVQLQQSILRHAEGVTAVASALNAAAMHIAHRVCSCRLA